MTYTRALRLRLIAAYVGALFAGLVCFAAAAVFGIDRSERSALDSHLSAAAQAVSALLDLRSGRPTIDRDDRRQFLTVLGAQTSGLVVDGSRKIVLSNVSVPPAALLAVPAATASYITTGSGEAELRAFVLPITNKGSHVGKIVVWRPSDWIDETDRQAAVAFLLAALVIAALAWFAGNAVTHRALDEVVSRQRRFTADASHDLRAPLAVIRAESDLALTKERDPDAYRQSLATISQEAERMESLIGDLLSVARADAGVLEIARVDLDHITREACARVAGAAAAKMVQLDFAASGRTQVNGNASELERAVLAVLHNAVKHAPAGGRIEVRANGTSGTVELSVRDNGAGFSPEALEHGLERFWRGDASGPGSGLGLAVADSIVQASGGTVRLSNVEGQAETRLVFPAA
jgi:signal transduction histidine kinase